MSTTLSTYADQLSLLSRLQADVEPDREALALAAERSKSFRAPVTSTIAETGLSAGFLEHLIFNTLYSRDAITGRGIADTLGLAIEVIEPVVADIKGRGAVEVKSSAGYGMGSSLFVLTEMGRKRAREYFEIHQYVGPAPVPLEQYCEAVASQRLRKGWLSKQMLAAAYEHAVVSPEVLEQIGPAVNSGRSFLMYGKPGNGKTYLAEALLNLLTEEVFIPYAVEYHGAITQIFDPLRHKRSADSDFLVEAVWKERLYDGRWAKCRRPFLASGGELEMDMLELRLDPATKVYDAPFHVKANNGIYLIDDFGRQRCTPAELLNRWIIPMESRVDHLQLRSRGNMAMPFEMFLVFSTNLTPAALGDEAFLRRIQYKMLVQNPSLEEFRELFRMYARKAGLDCPAPMLDRFLRDCYEKPNKPRRRCHPRDILLHVADLIEFLNLPAVLTEDVLIRAFESCFTAQDDDSE